MRDEFNTGAALLGMATAVLLCGLWIGYSSVKVGRLQRELDAVTATATALEVESAKRALCVDVLRSHLDGGGCGCAE